MRLRILAIIAVGLALVAAWPDSASAIDLDFPNFATQDDAQRYFESGGGSRFYDFNNLGADHDGIACELLPRGAFGQVAPSLPRSPTPAPTMIRRPYLTPTPDSDIVIGSTDDGLTGLGLFFVILFGVPGLYVSAIVLWVMISDWKKPKHANSAPPQIHGSTPPATVPKPRSLPLRHSTHTLPASYAYDTKTMPYEEYLRTPEWWAKRTAALRRAGYHCQRCPRIDSLEVHHRTYERRSWEAPGDLIVLCRLCHEKHHGIHRQPSD